MVEIQSTDGTSHGPPVWFAYWMELDSPWRVSIETEIRIACTHSHFTVDARLEAWEGENRVFHRTWNEPVPRLGV